MIVRGVFVADEVNTHFRHTRASPRYATCTEWRAAGELQTWNCENAP